MEICQQPVGRIEPDPGSNRLEPALEPLEPDHGCSNRLNWRCELPPGVDSDLLGEALEQMDFQARCNLPRLRVHRSPLGHEIVWVPSSGRVQIRVDISSPQEDREEAASAVYQDLARCLASTYSMGQEGVPKP